MAFPGDSDLPGTRHSMRFGGSSSTDAGGTLRVFLGKFDLDLTVLPHWESWLVL